MGWTNFIIVPKLKLVIEISRNINELDDYQKKALDYLTDEERYEDDNDYLENKSAKNISIKDLTRLFNTYEQANNLAGMESDKFFLYWLESKGIDYEIKSEFELAGGKFEQYKTEEYKILRKFEDKEEIKEN